MPDTLSDYFFFMKSLKKGFTLIELLVVITIIGILAVGGIGIFSTQLQKARDGTRMSDIKNYQTATEQYMSDNSSYPDPTDYTGSVKKYLSVLMQDPKEGQKNCLSGSTTQDCHYSYGA
jgi:general secretion pathway protein G